MIILGDKTMHKFDAYLLAGKLKKIYYYLPKGGGGFMESWAWVISPELFTQKEIERLRELDELLHQDTSDRMIANFLPDGIRPDDVPPL